MRRTFIVKVITILKLQKHPYKQDHLITYTLNSLYGIECRVLINFEQVWLINVLVSEFLMIPVILKKIFSFKTYEISEQVDSG